MGFEGAAAIRRGPTAPAAKPAYRQAFTALKHRDYRILWTAQAFSFMGMQMQQIARGLLAYKLTGSYAGMGIILMGWGLSQLVFGLFGGAVADRVNKRNIIIVAQAGTGALCLLTASSITFGFISVELLFLTGIAQGTLFAFNMPARQALVAELVPQPVLMNAIALNNVVMNATRIVGPAVAGLVISFGDAQFGGRGIEAAYYVQAAMYLGVLTVLIFLPASKSHLEGAANRRGIFSEIGAGLTYVTRSRVLLQLMLLAFISTLVGMPYMSLLPGFAVGELGVPASAFGIMMSVTGVGAIVGSLFIATMSDHPRKPLLQMVFGIGFGAGLIGLGLGSAAFGYMGALVALLGVGLFATTFQTLNNTMLMAETRPEYYGRVMSVYMLTFALFPLMAYPLGVVADAIGAKTTFVLMGVLIAGFVTMVGLLTPRWTFGRSSPVESTAGADAVQAPSPALGRGVSALRLSLATAAQVASVQSAASYDAPRRSRPAARLRHPRRDYMGGEIFASAPDYMRVTLNVDAGTSNGTSTSAGPAPLTYLGTSAYGLSSRQPVTTHVRPGTYGLERAPGLRSLPGARAVEAGDVVRPDVTDPMNTSASMWAPLALEPAVAESEVADPVGRFYQPPTERVEPPPSVRRRPEPSAPLLVSALTASVATSLLALLLRPQRRQ